ncbi:unnamed protein product [Fusarium graminearum]|nr:unnamed protein product [Fusarium graminearum]
MDQLADTFVEFQKYPFDLLGSLDSPGGSHVGAFARESLTNFTHSEMRTSGPFSSLQEYHASSIQLILDLIVRDEIGLTLHHLHMPFNSPIGFLPVLDFYSGSNDLGDDEVIFARLLEEKGHRDLTRFVRNDRLQHRFSFCCGYDLADWDGFLGLFRGLRDAVGVDEGS